MVLKKKRGLLCFSLSILFLFDCFADQEIGLREQFQYDGNDRLICKIAPDGNEIKYKYDERGLLVEINYPDESVYYGYDENGNRIWIKDKSGTTEYYYDAFNRLNGVNWNRLPWRWIYYEYDPWGRISYMAIINPQLLQNNSEYAEEIEAFTYPSENVPTCEKRGRIFQQMIKRFVDEDPKRKQQCLEYEVRYRYDIIGNLTGIDMKQGTVEYSHFPDKGQIERRLPNGISTRFTYSSDGLLKSLRHENIRGELISEYKYDCNPMGKVINTDELEPESLKTKTIGYSWDTRGYLKELHHLDGNIIRYNYDAMGNRLLKEDTTGTLRYDYDNFGRLIKAEDINYEWDKNGNLISQMEKQSKTTIRYDGKNLLTLINTSDTIIRYNWDGDGNMISRQIGNDTTRYLPNPLAPPGFTLAEFDKNGKLTTTYLYGDVLIGQQDMTGQIQYFLEDGFNSIRYITDINGKIMGQREYTPFADPIVMERNIIVDFRIAGERFLPEVKKYFIGNRLYDPSIGQYLSPDPEPGYIERFDSFNRYTHGDPNPANFMEPRCNQTTKNYIFGEALNRGAFFGTRFGEKAVEYYAQQQLKTGNPLYAIPGTIASLWMPETWKQTAVVLTLPLVSKIAGQTLLAKGVLAGSKSEPFHLNLLGKFVHYGISKFGPHIGIGLASKALIHVYLTHINIGGFRGADMFNTPLIQTGISVLIDKFESYENQLGGIEFSATGKFIGNLTNIVGAVYDPEKECLVLIGEKSLSVPSIKAEDLAVALVSVFSKIPQDPKFSLDPADPRNPRGEWLKAVYIPEEIISGTYFGKAMFEADWLLKQYAFGVSIDENRKLQERKSSVPSFKSTADLSLEEQGGEYGKERWARFWIISDCMILKEADNSIYYDVAKMRVKARKQIPDPSSPTGLRDVDTDEPVATKFANLFTDLYEEIAKESSEFEHVRELAKIIALAKWLKEEGIPIDRDWVVKCVNNRIETVDKVTAISVQWKKENKEPFVEGELRGIRTIIHELHLFGGIDLTVNPEYILDESKTRILEEVVKTRLREENVGPVFTIEPNGKSLWAVVLPITRNGQEMWKNSPSIEMNGVVYQFNNKKEITRSIDSDGNVTDYTYDNNHRLKTIKISNINRWKTMGERNEEGSLWTIANPRGNIFKYRYNTSGNLKGIEVDGHNYATYEIDEKKREVIVHYNGYTERVTYDESGNITKYEVKTEKGNSISAHETEEIIFTHGRFGNLTKVTGVGIPSINISYTEDGIRPTKISGPQTEIQCSYHLDGRIKEIIHSNGISLAYSYDGNRLAKSEVNYQNKQAEYLLSEDGIVQSRDLLGGEIKYSYEKGKISSVSMEQYGEARYIYDEKSRLKEMHFPDRSWIEYLYVQEKSCEKSPLVQSLTILRHPPLNNRQE